MKSKSEIQKHLSEVESDERLHYKPAKVDINAPLALIQVHLEAVSHTLRWVLDKPVHRRRRKRKD